MKNTSVFNPAIKLEQLTCNASGIADLLTTVVIAREENTPFISGMNLLTQLLYDHRNQLERLQNEAFTVKRGKREAEQ